MSDLNLQLFHWINLDAQSSGLWFWLARGASSVWPGVLLLIGVAVLCWRDLFLRRHVWRVLAALLLVWLLARGLSGLWPTPRPFVLGLGQRWVEHKPTPSFPSSHASVAFAVGVTLWCLVQHPLLRWVPPLLAMLVAWSRVALGLHFPLDVLAGAAVGGFSAWLAMRGVKPRLLPDPAGAPQDSGHADP